MKNLNKYLFLFIIQYQFITQYHSLDIPFRGWKTFLATLSKNSLTKNILLHDSPQKIMDLIPITPMEIPQKSQFVKIHDPVHPIAFFYYKIKKYFGLSYWFLRVKNAYGNYVSMFKVIINGKYGPLVEFLLKLLFLSIIFQTFLFFTYTRDVWRMRLKNLEQLRKMYGLPAKNRLQLGLEDFEKSVNPKVTSALLEYA